MNRWIRSATLLGVLGLLPACEVVDRVRGSAAGRTAQSGGLTLNLETPGTVRAGEDAVFRLNVWNRGDTAVTQLQAELFLPTWMQPLPPAQEGTVVTMVGSGEGTRLSYRISDPPLQPGESRTVVQPVRAPTGTWTEADVAPNRTVRAWLSDLAGQPLGVEITSDIVVEGLPEAPEAPVESRSDAGVSRDGVSGLRLGMTVAEVRQQFPNARDTTWSTEGMTERGVIVPVSSTGGAAAEGAVPVVARFHEGRIDQIRVRGRALRTAEGLGVGSRLEELRSAYGQTCVGIGEQGETVVWFARYPGVSFILHRASPPGAEAVRGDPSALPDSATVRELFVRSGGADGC